MDKNMIKIDDLLQQRFADEEERDRPAAWMQMRDLLDKQMPVTRAAVNWRRMFAYVAGVALLAAVSVGTYEMSDSFSAADEVAANSTTGTGEADAPVTNGLAGSAINSLPDTRVQAEAAAKAAQATDAANSTATTTPGAANSNQRNAGSANSNNSQQIAAADNSSNRKNSQMATNGNNSQKTADPSTSGNSAKNGQFAVDNNKADNSAVVKNNKPQQSATKPADANHNNAERTDKINTASSANNGNASAQISPNKPGNDNTTTGNKQGQNKQEALASNNKPTQPVDKKEIPISKIERVGKDGETKMDTIFNGKDVKTIQVPKEQLLAKNNNDEELASGSNINPSSAAPSAKKETSADDAPMQKLGDHKVASKKMKNYNPQRFEEMVKNAKYSLGSMKFYPGIVGGINASMNGNFGIQAGLAANLTIGDRWAILTEVKYAFRFNNVKENMQDDYIDNVQPTYLNGQFVYKYDSMQHYYTFNNYQSLEVPLMLTYTNNRFIYMLGANFRYNFKINNLTEVEQRYLLEQSYTTTSEPKFATNKQILLTDFGNSMGIAPMLGIGYQLTPGWRVDGRISQSVWNNAGTKGQKEIYKSLHNMPQVQFNLTYRLSSNKPYKRGR